MRPVEVVRGDGPVVLGMPHTGTWLPEDIRTRLNDTGRDLTDTDWHIDRLYDGLLPGATVVRATFHRYVIDANRDPDGASLYPGQNTTGLVPLTDFDGRDIWAARPDTAEVAERRARYHGAYHHALTVEMGRVAERHGFALLYDCHSIRSEIPFLFQGTLPVLNIGTDDGATCDPAIEDLVAEIARGSGIDTAVNGRFKGGWTTRHYGRPERGWHAIQMEIAQRAYLSQEAAPWPFDPGKAERLRAVLHPILDALSRWRPDR